MFQWGECRPLRRQNMSKLWHTLAHIDILSHRKTWDFEMFIPPPVQTFNASFDPLMWKMLSNMQAWHSPLHSPVFFYTFWSQWDPLDIPWHSQVGIECSTTIFSSALSSSLAQLRGWWRLRWPWTLREALGPWVSPWLRPLKTLGCKDGCQRKSPDLSSLWLGENRQLECCCGYV